MDKREDALLAKMTLTEKIGQMVQIADCNGSIPDDLRQKLREGRIGSMLNVTKPEVNREIQRIAVEESRLGIPLIMARDVIHGYRTLFQFPWVRRRRGIRSWPKRVQASPPGRRRAPASSGHLLP